MVPWAKPGGMVVLPASDGTEEPRTPREIESLDERSYVVPEVETRRLLWVARLRSE